MIDLLPAHPSAPFLLFTDKSRLRLLSTFSSPFSSITVDAGYESELRPQTPPASRYRSRAITISLQ